MRGAGEALVFIHDGSFPGFLSAACEALDAAGPGTSTLVRGPCHAPTLFEEGILVDRDEERAAGLWSRLRARGGEEVLRTLLEAFSSDLAGADGSAAVMIGRLLREGRAPLDDLDDESARLVEKAAKRTRKEAHKMTGLLRFRELADSSLLATIDPDCDLLLHIADHFAARFPAYRWAIRDERRDLALVHEPGRGWSLGRGFEVRGGRLGLEDAVPRAGSAESHAHSDTPPGVGAYDPPLAEAEEGVVGCWRRYFESVAIGERANPRLQASFMPKKYWKNLPETQPPGG